MSALNISKLHKHFEDFHAIRGKVKHLASIAVSCKLI